MSGKSGQQKKAGVRQAARSAEEPGEQPVGHRSQKMGSKPRRIPKHGNPSPKGEIGDPLGNFSEQVGAYFG